MVCIEVKIKIIFNYRMEHRVNHIVTFAEH